MGPIRLRIKRQKKLEPRFGPCTCVSAAKSLFKNLARCSNFYHQTDEEQAVVGWVLRAAATGHPVTHSFLRQLAEEIRKPRVTPDNSATITVPPLGADWSKRFMRRNPQLRTAMAKGIGIQRKEVTREILERWFAEFKRVVEEYGIDPDNIYQHGRDIFFMYEEFCFG